MCFKCLTDYEIVFEHWPNNSQSMVKSWTTGDENIISYYHFDHDRNLKTCEILVQSKVQTVQIIIGFYH